MKTGGWSTFWIVSGTLVVGLLLTLFPLPGWAEMLRPAWVQLVLIYWVMTLPGSVGLFAGFLFSRRLVHSSFGLALRGIRENVRRMPAIGSDYRAHLRAVYALSAAMAGAAGALLTQTTDTVSLDTLSFQRSADVVVMLILGGTGRLYGAILGALIFMLARDQLAGMNPQYWYFWIGLLLMAVVLVMPRGILGGLARLAGRRHEA